MGQLVPGPGSLLRRSFFLEAAVWPQRLGYDGLMGKREGCHCERSETIPRERAGDRHVLAALGSGFAV